MVSQPEEDFVPCPENIEVIEKHVAKYQNLYDMLNNIFC
jgi:hypothetical protein